MKKILLCFCSAAFLLSCNNEKTEPAATATTTTPEKSMVELPYTASYSSSWSTEISDADLKMVLTTYKDWENSNMSGLESSLADSVTVEFSSGDRFTGTKPELMKLWTTYRDSLSSVTIDMEGWNKMYSTDKKESFVVTWYKEYDTYKTGKVDSASYHDINLVKNGKIIWYSQYKRKLK